MKSSKLAALVALCLMTPGAMSQTTNLFQNSSFELKSVGWYAQTYVGSHQLRGGFPYTGSRSYTASCSSYCGEARYILWQDLATAPGQSYDIYFYARYAEVVGTPYAHIAVFWNGTLVAEFTRNSSPYLRHDVPNLFATGETTRFEVVITMTATNGVTSQARLDLDDFAAVPSGSPVPEPEPDAPAPTC